MKAIQCLTKAVKGKTRCQGGLNYLDFQKLFQWLGNDLSAENKREVFEKELTTQFSKKALQETIASLSKDYKIQTEGRGINLFYLKEDRRERVEYIDNQFKVINTELVFTKAEILEELTQYPERFSPNVVLRPLFQESILPNIAFIGGAGELAYWLELKRVFDFVEIPYPVLVLRNSFSIIVTP